MIKSTPFMQGDSIEFQVGYLFLNDEKKIRYTRSLKKFRSYYRITLQIEGDPEHNPYVFNVIREEAELVIEPENEGAKSVWGVPMLSPYKELHEALVCIYTSDIEQV